MEKYELIIPMATVAALIVILTLIKLEGLRWFCFGIG